ncbi:hypothetical protein DXA34_22785, partial [[Clostridium] symbiosum]
MNFLLKYQSPIILISSIFLFKVLIGIEIKNVAMCKIITFISKISFGLYFRSVYKELHADHETGAA